MDDQPRASLSDKQARGGVIGAKGYGFQAAYIVSRVPHWLADPEFFQFLQEGAGDVDVRFNRAEGEERWYVQVKNYSLTPSTARQTFSQFSATDAGSPGTYTRFTLACPGLNDDLKKLRSAVEELRGAAPFYRPGQDPLLDNTWSDLEHQIQELDLPMDASFLVDKVHFDTDLAGLRDDASLRDLFVGRLLKLDAWATASPKAAARAYEKLALLCHQEIRVTCSQDQLEALIHDAVGEQPRTTVPASGIWSRLSAAVAARWKVLLALLLTNSILFLLLPTLQAHFLVAPLVVVCVAILASLSILGWTAVASRRWLGWRGWSLSAGASVLLVGVLAWQVGQAVFPPKFSTEEFGIVVATFGEGHDLRPSRKGREITYDIVERLNQEAGKPDAPANVRAREVGIVKSSQDANKVASRHNANLVVWGRLVVGEEAVTVHFKIVEPLASGSGPEYPRVLPIGYTYSAQVSDYAADIRGIHHFDLKDDIAGQSSAITYFVLGLAHHLDYEYQDAILMFQEAKVALDTERSDLARESAADLGLIHYYLGRSYQRLGLFEKAVTELEVAADLNEQDPAARLDLAYCYQSLGRTEEADATLQEAIAICQDVLSSDPESVEALYDLGLAYQVLGENSNALATYLRLIEVEPGFHVAYVSAGAVYAEEGRVDASVRMYQEAIKRAGDAGLGGAEAYLGLAEVYLHQGRADLALENYLQAVELKPEHDWVHYRLARFYEAQGDIDLAWEEYEKAVEYSDNEVWANTVLGDFLRGQKLYDLAIESYETARMHDLDDAIVYIRLGEVYLDRYESPDRREGDAEKAEEAFTEALANVPDYFPIQFYIYAPRGRLYYAQQRLDEAAADFESALEWNPTSPEIQLSLARSYDDVGDWQSACGAYRKLLEPEMKAAEDWVAYAHERMAIVCAGGG